MKLAALVLFFFLIPFSIFSFGKKEKNAGSEPSPAITIGTTETIESGNQADGVMENTVKILGKVQIYGNAPYTYVGIVDEDGNQYSVYPPSKEEELMGLQGHLIEFSVIVLDTPQGSGGLFLKGGTVTPVAWEIIR